ncbi:MAG TPA: major capsid protein [Chromobacteriaceae bacterium]|nr:major capsid protein [Chromobacteriaceae bacterium]
MKHFIAARRFAPRLALAGVIASPALAFAAPVTVDTTDIVAQIAAGATAIAAIGIAVLSLYALGRCFKLVKTAF